MKNCSMCYTNKPLGDFYNRSECKDGLRPNCKVCSAAISKRYREANRGKLLEQQRQWREANKDKKSKYSKQYYQDNKAQAIASNSRYIANRKLYDVEFKLVCNLRSRLCGAINRNTKSGSAVKDLGCSVKELKLHLESQFQPGMTWDNWSIGGWHIDHILPLSKFNLTNHDELLKACNYTNLQPLWAIDNIKKGNKMPQESNDV